MFVICVQVLIYSAIMKNLSYFKLRWLVFSTMGILLFNPVSAQPPDLSGIMTDRMPDCNDIRFNAMTLIPEYFKRNEVDSAIMVLDYWTYHCGKSQESYPAQVLLNMHRDSVPIDDRPMAGFFGWGWSVHPYEGSYGLWTYRRPTRMVDRSRAYYDFLRGLAENQAARQDLPPFEHLTALYFAGQQDSLLSAYRHHEFPERPSQADYLNRLDAARRMIEFHYGFFAGAWIPTDNLSMLGTHPEMGFLMGLQFDRFIVDFTFAIKFVKAAEEYRFVKGDSTYTTDNFFGVTLGGDFGYRLVKTPKSEIQLIGGIAYDNFTVVPYDDETEAKSITADALNLNLGFNYRYYFQGDMYLGLRMRYNALNYNSHGGSDLSGDAVSVGLAFGWAGNGYKSRQLSQLGVGR